MFTAMQPRTPVGNRRFDSRLRRATAAIIENLESRTLLSVTNYTVVDLGTLGGTSAVARAVNAAGYVVGSSTTASGQTHAFVYNPATSQMTDLGTLGGATSDAYAINDAGQVAGASQRPDGTTHAFRYDPSTGIMTDLGTLGGTGDSFGYAIDGAGRVAGKSATASGQTHAFVSTGAGLLDLDTLGGTQSAIYAYDAGTDKFYGSASLPGDQTTHIAAFDADAPLDPIADLGADAGWLDAEGFAVSNGMLVGRSHTSTPLWTNAISLNLATGEFDTLNGSGTHVAATALNASGTIIGNTAYESSSTGNVRHAALVFQDPAQARELATLVPTGSPITPTAVHAIDSAGRIFGSGSTSSGNFSAIMLVPAPGDTGSITGMVWDAGDGSPITYTENHKLGIGGARVYVDSNKNGVFNTGEPNVITTASGRYAINGLAAGTYAVRVQMPSGYSLHNSAPAPFNITVSNGQVAVARDFAGLGRYTVNGTIFFDADRDGIRDENEGPLTGWRVWISGFNSELPATSFTPPNATTDGEGRFTLPSLTAAQTISLVAAPPVGQPMTEHIVTTAPMVLVGYSGETNDVSFGYGPRVGRTILGHVKEIAYSYTDASSPTPVPVAGRTIYLDLDNSGTLTGGDVSTTSNSFGRFFFDDLPSGSYAVRQTIPAGWGSLSAASDGPFNLTLGTSASSFGLAGTFNSWRYAQVKGVAFNDLNFNGLQDNGELPLARRLIFQDFDNDGVHDAIEPSTTSQDDGTYTLLARPGARSMIVQALPLGWDPTSPPMKTLGSTPFVSYHELNILGGSVHTGKNFGSIQPNGLIYGGVTELGNGQPNNGLAGRRVFIDANGNDAWDEGERFAISEARGWFVINDLGPGTFAVRQEIPSGWYGSSIPSIGSTVTLNYAGSSQSVVFSQYRLSTASGKVFDDTRADGNLNSIDTGVAGVTVFADYNRDFIQDAGEPSTVTGSDGVYTFTDLKPGLVYFVAMVPNGYQAVSKTTNNAKTKIYKEISVTSGSATTSTTFAIAKFVEITGRIFYDLNGDGVRQSGEAYIRSDCLDGPFTVYVDNNANGTYGAGDWGAMSNADFSYQWPAFKPGNYTLRVDGPAGLIVTSPGGNGIPFSFKSGDGLIVHDFGVRLPGNVIAGTVFDDLNGNGSLDAGEPGIPHASILIQTSGSSSSVRTYSDTDGNYVHFGVLDGTYEVYQQAVAGYQQTSPLTATQTVTLTGNATLTGRNFANEMKTGSISGIVFEDVNNDGVRQSGEPVMANAWIYFDHAIVNWVGGRPRVATDANGAFTLTGLVSGIYLVNAEYWQSDPDHLQSTPTVARTVTLSVGGSKGGLSLGLYQPRTLDIVVDNTSAGVTKTGAWGTSNTVTGYYGGDYLHDNKANKGSLSVTYTSTVLSVGRYDVYAWWPARSDRSPRVPYDVVHRNGTTTVFVDQRTKGVSWQYLGTFDFGTSGSVRVRNAGTTGYVGADAVRFYRIGQTPAIPVTPPVAPNGLHGAVVSSSTINVSWNENATNESGYILQRSTSAGFETFVEKALPANTTAENVTGLSAGTTYYFRVKSINAAGASNWSEVASWTTTAVVPGPAEIILDNPQATLTGTWGSGTSSPGFFGANYLHDNKAGKGTKTARYTPAIAEGGTYDVFAWWNAKSDRSNKVPYTIQHAGGSTVVFANQRLNGGTWVKLGTFAFNAGSGGWVQIGTNGTSGYVIADAVKFTKTTATPPPVAFEQILDNSAAGVTKSAGWSSSTTDRNYYGVDYLHDGNTRDGTKWVKFTPTLPAAGKYQVWARWTSATNKSTKTPFTIATASGNATVVKNQRTNGGTWVLLGEYDLLANGTAAVTVANLGTDGYAVADAVKFVRMS